jgi:adenylate cyclase
MKAFESAYLIVAIMMAGTALIFTLSDWRTRSTRALSLCLLAIAAAAFFNVLRGGGLPTEVPGALFDRTCKILAILAGLEWGRRIGLTAQARPRVAANVLFRVAQLLTLIYGLMTLGYVLLFPAQALRGVPGLVAVRPVEFAVFAPVLGSGLLCAVIAGLMLRFMRIDRAELARLRALFIASPFLLAGLIVAESLIPIMLSIGLLIFLTGSVRYLVIQGRRGDFMRQFLSPDLARLVQRDGLDRVLKRERRMLSVLVCDLRGFTTFAHDRDSDAVASVLEAFYGFIGQKAAALGGTVKDHAGDGVLILVGAPIALRDHARRAAVLALELMDGFGEVIAPLAPGVGLGIGVATGMLTVGAIRGAGRLEYVAVGNAVNLASRLCMRAGVGEVLVDQPTVDQGLQGVAGRSIAVRALSPESFKGFDEPVAIHAITSDGRPLATVSTSKSTRRAARRS